MKLFGGKFMASVSGNRLQDLQQMHQELQRFNESMNPDKQGQKEIQTTINTFMPRVQAFAEPLEEGRKKKEEASLRREYNACVDMINSWIVTLGIMQRNRSAMGTMRRCESQSRLIALDEPGTPKSRIDSKKGDSESSDGGTPKQGHKSNPSLSLSRLSDHANPEPGTQSRTSTPKNAENEKRAFRFSVTPDRPSLLMMAQEGPADHEDPAPPMPQALQTPPALAMPPAFSEEGNERELSVKEPHPHRPTISSAHRPAPSVSVTQQPSQPERHSQNSNNGQDPAAESSSAGAADVQPAPPANPLRLHLERIDTLPPKGCCCIQ